MNNLLTHYPVNWIDGMKLSSSHFIAVQDFVTDSVRDAEPSILLWGIKTSIDEIESFSNKIIETKGIKNVNISKINDIVNNIKFLKNMELNADEYFSIKNNADGIIFLRNKLKVLWKKNNMDSNLLNTKVHHNH